MKNISNKGFVLAELLVVCVFLMIMFSMLYSNYLPLQGQYEVREGYDDVDSKYAVYWIKRMVEDLDYQAGISSDYENDARRSDYNKTYAQFKCENFNKSSKQEMCKKLLKSMHAECAADGTNCKVYITRYNLHNFHEAMKSNVQFTSDEAFYDYLFYLPDYNTPSLNNASYRVIAKFKTGEVVNYSTIEVNR